MDLEKTKKEILLEKKANKIKSVTLSEVVEMSYQELMDTRPEDVISYGYDWLDSRLAGIFKGELILIGGESGTGKSTFATNIVYKASKTVKCAIFALEERLENYGKKAVYFAIGKIRKSEGKKNYPYNVYIRGELNHLPEFQKYYARAFDLLKNENVLFQKVEEKLSFDILKKRLEILHSQGVELILLDHLHYFDLLRGNNTKSDYIEEIMTDLHLLLNKTGLRLLLIAHYRKLNNTKPTLDSFKDSISIVQNADHVINIWRDREEKGDSEMEKLLKYQTTFYIPKTRNINGEATITVTFNPDTYDYTDPKETSGGTYPAENFNNQNGLEI